MSGKTSGSGKCKAWGRGTVMNVPHPNDFAGIQRRYPAKVRACDCCSSRTAQKASCWLTERWLCESCAERYLRIEASAKAHGEQFDRWACALAARELSA